MSDKQLENLLEALFSDAVIPDPKPEPIPEEAGPQSPPPEPSAAEPEMPETEAGVESPLAVAAGPESQPPTIAPETEEKARDVTLRVLLVEPDSKSAQILTDFFTKRGNRVRQATNIVDADFLLEQSKPGLVVVDWDLVDDGWQYILQQIRQRFPDTKVLLTNKYPDSR